MYNKMRYNFALLCTNGLTLTEQKCDYFCGIKIYGTPTSFSKFMGCKVEATRYMTVTVRVNIMYCTSYNAGSAESVKSDGKERATET